MQSRLSHKSVCGGDRAQLAICVLIRSHERHLSALQNSLQRAVQTANLQWSEAEAAAHDMSTDDGADEQHDGDGNADADLDEDSR